MGKARETRNGEHRQGTAAWPSCAGREHARSPATLSPATHLPDPRPASRSSTRSPSLPRPTPPSAPLCLTPLPLCLGRVRSPRTGIQGPCPLAPLHLRPRARLSSLRHLSSLHPKVHFRLLQMGCTCAASQAAFLIPLNPERALRLPGEGAWRTLLREPLLFRHPRTPSPLKMGSWAVTPGGEVPGPSQ